MQPLFQYEQTSPGTISLVIDGEKSWFAIIQNEGRFLATRHEQSVVYASFDRLYDAKRFLEEMIEDDIRHLAYQGEIDTGYARKLKGKVQHCSYFCSMSICG
jgi:hypothetical protein